MSSMSDIKKRLEEMRHMKDNWDSYGALAPSKRAIDRALIFVDQVLDNPSMCASVNGGIVFQGNNFTIEIGPHADSDEIYFEKEE